MTRQYHEEDFSTTLLPRRTSRFNRGEEEEGSCLGKEDDRMEEEPAGSEGEAEEMVGGEEEEEGDADQTIQKGPRLYASLRQFMAFVYQRRKLIPNKFTRGDKLGKLFLIDKFMRMLQQRNSFIRKKGAEFMTSTRAKMLKAKQRLADSLNLNITNRAQFSVPHTASELPRSLHKKYGNAISMCNSLGRPDLFTANAAIKSKTESIVLKEYLLTGKGMNSAKRYEFSNQMQTIAAFLAKKFLEEIKRVTKLIKKIKFIKIRTLYLPDGPRYMSAERRFDSTAKFIRFSNNATYEIMEKNALALGVSTDFVQLVTALSHWTHKISILETFSCKNSKNPRWPESFCSCVSLETPARGMDPIYQLLILLVFFTICSFHLLFTYLKSQDSSSAWYDLVNQILTVLAVYFVLKFVLNNVR